jgi:DNA mismatch endonuclease, patch repair protein
VDTLTPAERSAIMARVRSKDSKPELIVRKMLYAMGYHYRLHAKELPGKPDIVFRQRRKAIFVHGCFWHRHESCSLARLPKSRLEFWIPKLEKNRERDRQIRTLLKKLHWRTLTIWECEIDNPIRIQNKIRRFLDA